MEPWQDRFARVVFERSADTAHDLKTPLNIAVLNLELLRMRMRKLAGEDPKVDEYSRAVELELRRLARIFDAFFGLAVPPRDGGPPVAVPIDPIVAELAAAAGVAADAAVGSATVQAHERRIREMVKLFFAGAAGVMSGECELSRAADEAGNIYTVTLRGAASEPAAELQKLFKLYYSTPDGTPDVSLASARLIAETYGGSLTAAEEDGKLTLQLSMPLGER